MMGVRIPHLRKGHLKGDVRAAWVVPTRECIAHCSPATGRGRRMHLSSPGDVVTRPLAKLLETLSRCKNRNSRHLSVSLESTSFNL